MVTLRVGNAFRDLGNVVDFTSLRNAAVDRLKTDVMLTWFDSEGDKVRIESQTEFAEALKESNGKQLIVYAVAKDMALPDAKSETTTEGAGTKKTEVEKSEPKVENQETKSQATAPKPESASNKDHKDDQPNGGCGQPPFNIPQLLQFVQNLASTPSTSADARDDQPDIGSVLQQFMSQIPLRDHSSPGDIEKTVEDGKALLQGLGVEPAKVAELASSFMPMIQEGMPAFCQMMDSCRTQASNEEKCLMALEQMKTMGFEDDSGYLLALLRQKDGEINKVLELLEAY